MTREEAIEILEANRPDPCYQMLREAVDFAVDALKAQIDKDINVPNTDCIYRQVAIDAPVKMVSEGLDWIPVYHIKDLPSAQPEIIRCKDCKNWDTTWSGNWADGGYYCPNVDGVRDGDFYCADAERRTDE